MTTEERIDKLERELENMKRVMRTRTFIIEDENGKPRAELGVDKDGPRLMLMDENGNHRVELGVDKDGSGLSLSDENGNIRAGIVVSKDGPGLALLDDEGKRIFSAP